MLTYPISPRGDLDGLQDLGDPADIGGTVVEGNPRISGRFDYRDGGLAAGLFRATTGTVRIDYPFNEHATILEGEVTLTDEAGRSHTYRPGDSFFIRQGEIILWKVSGRHVTKSFFNVPNA